MQALGKEEKGRKQGTETRLTLSRTNTIATNLDLQNIFKLTKKKISNELTATCFRGRKSLLCKNTEVGMCSFTYLPHDGIICFGQRTIFE